MTKPAQNLGDRFNCFPRGNERPTDHHHRQRKITRRFDLGRGRVAAGIPRDDDVSVEILKDGPIGRAVEWPARHDDLRLGQRQWIARRIDQPNQVNVLRVLRENLQVLSADAEEYPACLKSESLGRGHDIIDLDPPVARRALPGRTFQRQQRHPGGPASPDGTDTHLRSEWMGGIDDTVNIFRAKVVHEAGNAAKAADTPGNRRRQRIFRAAGIGQHRIDIRTIRQSRRQPVRVGGAAEDQNAQSSRW